MYLAEDLGKDGPDHMPSFRFSATIQINGESLRSVGVANTKKLSKEQAAQDLHRMIS